MSRSRWLLLVAIALAVGVIAAFDPGRFLNLAYVQAQQADLQTYVAGHPARAAAWAFAIYTGVTALSVPGAAIMTLAIGGVFGLACGTLLVSFASTLGATFAFLSARYLLRGYVQARFGHRLEAINRGLSADGPAYLLTLRLIPLFPFVAVNLLLALTPISLRNFYLYSQLGMLPGTLVFVNAGTRLAQIERLSDVLSAPLLWSFALLGALPFVAKFTTRLLARQRFLERFPPPPAVDRNIIVIGAGSAGLVAALIAAAVRAKVTLIEGARMGGDCLNTGCVPSKALLRAAKHIHQARTSSALGIRRMAVEFDFAEVMDRVAGVVAAIAPHDSRERFESLGVECISGRARVLSPYTVAVNGRELSARAIILATGAEPLVPPLPGLDAITYLTSDTVWGLRSVPARLLVLGGGPIGCEFAQAFARFGSTVTVVEMAPRLLPREDVEVSLFVHEVFTGEGIRLELGARAVEFRRRGNHGQLRCARPTAVGSGEFTLEFDEVIVAVGRRPRVSGFGLEELGVPLSARGTVEVNDYLETHLPTVYACGDVASPYQFTHVAAHQAWYATINALFGQIKRLAVDYRVIPWCTFIDPEVARVGINEQEARERGIAFEITRYDLSELDRAIADGTTRGFVKVLTPPGSDRILGATIVGAHAGDVIAEFVLAMTHHLGLNKILGTIHIYPTLAEASKFTAGAWRRAHASARVLGWLERYHRWRRSG